MLALGEVHLLRVYFSPPSSMTMWGAIEQAPGP
jgi:hypothetical protein